MFRGERENLVFGEDPRANSALVVNLDTALPYMQYRKKTRQYEGTYSAQNGTAFVVVMFALLFLWTFTAFYSEKIKQ